MLGTLLAQIAAKPSPSPSPTGIMKYIDAANDTLTNANFETAIRNPWFLLFSAAVIIFAIFRSQKALLITYVGGIVMWGIVHHTVLKDQSTSAGSQSVYVFAGLVVAVAGLGIYFLLIRD